jgi:hypothetical protein
MGSPKKVNVHWGVKILDINFKSPRTELERSHGVSSREPATFSIGRKFDFFKQSKFDIFKKWKFDSQNKKMSFLCDASGNFSTKNLEIDYEILIGCIISIWYNNVCRKIISRKFP